MQLSTTIIPLAAGQTLAMSSGCYLVQTSDEKNILIDSGLPADYTPSPGTPSAEDEKNVLEHLAELDLHPDDIDLLICTPFDVDHAGYHDAFTERAIQMCPSSEQDQGIVLAHTSVLTLCVVGTTFTLAALLVLSLSIRVSHVHQPEKILSAGRETKESAEAERGLALYLPNTYTEHMQRCWVKNSLGK